MCRSLQPSTSLSESQPSSVVTVLLDVCVVYATDDLCAAQHSCCCCIGSSKTLCKHEVNVLRPYAALKLYQT